MIGVSQPIVRKFSIMEDIKEKLIDEAKRIEEDSLYSAKGHFEAANKWRNIHLWLGLPTAVLAALSGVSALTQFDYHNILAAFLAIFVAALTSVITFLNPNEKASSHQDAGNKYNSLRNKVRIFYEIDCRGKSSVEELTKRLNEFGNLRDELNQNSPQIPREAYERARKGIKEGEADYEVDKKKILC